MTKDREYLKALCWRICEEACQRIDDPKNVEKGDGWRELRLEDLGEMLGQETVEFEEALGLWPVPEAVVGEAHARHEAGDMLVVMAMLLDAKLPEGESE